MQLSAFNLNHLVALDHLLRERHVGRAAARQGVTQSAMSHTLRTLREAMNDPLLVRVGNDMVLTPYAEQMRQQLERGLADLGAVVSGRAAFDPSTITDTFTVATLDGVAASTVRQLWSHLTARAPRARLKIAPLIPTAMGTALESGAVDVVLTPPMFDVSHWESEALVAHSPRFETMVILGRRGHPDLGPTVTLDEYCRLSHVIVSVTGDGKTMIDALLARQGRSREIAASVPFVAALAELLASSNLITTTIVAMADFLGKHWPLQTWPLPFELPLPPMLMVWHPRFSAEPAHRFFRDVVRVATEASTRADPRTLSDSDS